MISLTNWGGLFFRTLRERDRKIIHSWINFGETFHTHLRTKRLWCRQRMHHWPTWLRSAAEQSEPRCGRWWPHWRLASPTSTAYVCNYANKKAHEWVTKKDKLNETVCIRALTSINTPTYVRAQGNVWAKLQAGLASWTDSETVNK